MSESYEDYERVSVPLCRRRLFEQCVFLFTVLHYFQMRPGELFIFLTLAFFFPLFFPIGVVLSGIQCMFVAHSEFPCGQHPFQNDPPRMRTAPRISETTRDRDAGIGRGGRKSHEDQGGVPEDRARRPTALPGGGKGPERRNQRRRRTRRALLPGTGGGREGLRIQFGRHGVAHWKLRGHAPGILVVSICAVFLMRIILYHHQDFGRSLLFSSFD